ncbi:hypothetical protein BC834DRAFT_974268 [Gloeopeniophorella convolvens]|nr:hypothetical protein BC834DRAFT_974268 [Gloeopeniophorella convolvens]
MVQIVSFVKALGVCGLLALKVNAQAFPVPTLTPAQVTAAQIALVQQAQTPESQDKLAADVAAAAAVAAGIAQNFTNIGTELLTIDNKDLQPAKFFPTWQIFRNTYDELLQDAKNLASSVSGYADEFNQGVLNIVSNPDIPSSSKLTVLNTFIAKSTTFQNSSSILAVQFNELASNITEFTGSFANFAANRSASDNQQIDSLLAQIGQLQKEVADIEVSMLALGAAMGATLLGSAAGLVFFPEAAPFIVIGAAIAEGILAATEIGLATTYAIDQNKISGLQGDVQSLRNDINLINATQSALNSTATKDIPTLTAHLGLFTGVWQDVASDCTKLVGWLQDGASFVVSQPSFHVYQDEIHTEVLKLNSQDLPDILAVYLNQSTTIYDTMSAALTQYATQVPTRK